MFNILETYGFLSTRKVGGIRFIKIGKLCFSFCMTKQYKPVGG